MFQWNKYEIKNEYHVFNIEYFLILWHNVKCNNKYTENKRVKK